MCEQFSTAAVGHMERWTQRAVEGLTACTECDVTGNEHTDVTTMGYLTHTHRTVSAILHL